MKYSNNYTNVKKKSIIWIKWVYNGRRVHKHNRHVISGILVTEDGQAANCTFQNYAYYLRQVQAKLTVHRYKDFNYMCYCNFLPYL
jgi:hypothetical protein